MLKQVFGNARSCRKRSSHYLTSSTTGLMILSLALMKKMSLIATKIKILQALNNQLQEENRKRGYKEEQNYKLSKIEKETEVINEDIFDISFCYPKILKYY